MHPLWDTIIEPAIVASRAKRVVEIGALRGETTTRLLDLLGPDAEIHVIDPVPNFDPTDHARRFPGRYVFHREPSHSVLPSLQAVDAALIDGDHNWFTVLGELRMLRDAARSAGAPLPLLVMHDVGWPYGRRDLYYDPDRIPPDQRQPYATKGMVPGRSALVDEGGLNPQLANALAEGGPRNGVLTALEDFAAEHDRPLRTVIVPVYWGLALVAEERLLAERDELAAIFERLDSPEALRDLVELGEAIRVGEQTRHQEGQRRVMTRAERAARLYLGLLKDVIRDEHAEPRTERLLDELQLRMDVVREELVEGDVVARGVDRVGAATFLRGYLRAHGLGRRKLLAGAGDQAPASAERVALLCVDDPGEMRAALDEAYDRITLGGFVVIGDYANEKGRAVVDGFRAERGVAEPLERFDWGGAAWRKLEPER